MDSPGFNAQFCTYTFLENETKDIVAMEIVDKREVDNVGVNMEKYGFIKGMEGLLNRGVTIEEVVTDAHSQISALMTMRWDWGESMRGILDRVAIDIDAEVYSSRQTFSTCQLISKYPHIKEPGNTGFYVILPDEG